MKLTVSIYKFVNEAASVSSVGFVPHMFPAQHTEKTVVSRIKVSRRMIMIIFFDRNETPLLDFSLTA